MLTSFILILSIIIPSLSQSCDIGFYFDGTSCFSCDQRCYNCLSNLICTTCKQQAYLKINQGGLSCKYCKQVIDGCLFCQSDSVCQTCQPSYSLQDGICISLPGGSISIIQCQPYQVSVNGNCFNSIAYCLRYSNDGTCGQCQNGAALMQGYCIPTSLTQSFTSSTCTDRQYLSDGVCKDVGIECLTFTNDGNCTQCSAKFTLFRGMCVQSPQKDSAIIVSYIPQKHHMKTNQQSITNNVQNSVQHSNPISNAQNRPKQSTGNHQVRNHESNASNHSKQGSFCTPPCDTCSEDPKFCISCLDGFTTVDQMPGVCFEL